jgi:adenylate kinase
MFREMKSSETPLAREVQEIMASGKLISDDITYRIVRERTSKPDTQGTYVLDGYPRTAVQAEQLEELAKEQGKDIQAIEVHVPLDELMKRLTGRRSCPVCGEIYNIYSKPPRNEGFCDFHPQSKLDHRADDSDEKVKVRLETYDELTKPLLEYYGTSGRLKKVDGTGEIENIYKQLDALV